jgi:hypothetical protein
MVVAMGTATAAGSFMRSAQITMSSKLGQGMTRKKNSGSGEDAILDSFFQGKLRTAAVADAGETAV